jgi:hypothetical protein
VTSTAAPRPRPAVLEIDGFAWQPARTSDAPALEALAAQAMNRVLFGLPPSSEAFEAAVGGPGFRNAMLCWQDSIPIGAASTGQRNLHSENVRLTCFFAEPAHAALPLAAYVRHLFWRVPFHRVYCQFPLVARGAEYVDLLKACGFREEGIIRGHALIGGNPYDVAVLGVLRDEFDIWCRENETRLAL